jgi:hypothetical protein
MECRFQDRVQALVAQLAREHQQELADAGTLVDLEDLTCEIGDEVTRLLTEQELVRRVETWSPDPVACPDCSQASLPDAEPEPVVLTGLRGTLAFNQPKHFCSRCRRSFFPAVR